MIIINGLWRVTYSGRFAPAWDGPGFARPLKLAFGRAVAASRRWDRRRAEALLYLEANGRFENDCVKSLLEMRCKKEGTSAAKTAFKIEHLRHG
jgi:hypothetical protein